MSSIDVEHRADGVSLTLASQGFELSVRLSQSEADELIEQLTMERSEPAGPGSDADCQPPAQPSGDSAKVGC